MSATSPIGKPSPRTPIERKKVKELIALFGGGRTVSKDPPPRAGGIRGTPNGQYICLRAIHRANQQYTPLPKKGTSPGGPSKETFTPIGKKKAEQQYAPLPKRSLAPLSKEEIEKRQREAARVDDFPEPKKQGIKWLLSIISTIFARFFPGRAKARAAHAGGSRRASVPKKTTIGPTTVRDPTPAGSRKGAAAQAPVESEEAVYTEADKREVEALKRKISSGESDEETIQQFTADCRQYLSASISKITPEELLTGKINDPEKAPNCVETRKKMEALSNSVSRHVLSEQNPKIRGRIIKFYLAVIKESLKQGDFSTASALTAGLSNSAVFRLLDAESRGDLPSLIPGGTIEKAQEAHKGIKVPAMHRIFTKAALLGESSKTREEKRTALEKALQDLKKFQEEPRKKTPPLTPLMKSFDAVETLSDKEAEALSLELKPR